MLDNASYHNVQIDKKTNRATVKKELQEWLKKKDTLNTKNMTKVELQFLVQNVPAQDRYTIL